jgi:hypothetical protein
MRIDWHLDSQPGMIHYLVHADSFIGVHLEHPGYEISGSGVESVREGVNTF